MPQCCGQGVGGHRGGSHCVGGSIGSVGGICGDHAGEGDMVMVPLKGVGLVWCGGGFRKNLNCF